MMNAFKDFGGLFGYDLFKVLIILVITAIAFLLSKWIIRKILLKWAGKTKTSLDDRLFNVSGGPLRFVILVVGINYALQSYAELLTPGVKSHFDSIFYVLIAGTITLWLMRMVTNFFEWYAETIAIRTESSADDEFIPLIIRLTKIAIGSIALIVMLKHFNQDVQSLVVSLGVGSLALALAAQETLSNMIAGFVIMTDRPFRVGDRIELSDGKVGDVYQVGLRSTKLMTFDNTLVIVPNSEIVKERVVNRSYPDPLIRVRIDVGVAYSSDVDKVKKVLIDIFKNHPQILDDPEPKAYFLNFGDSSLDFMVQGRVNSWKKQFATSDELRSQILKRFNEEGIEIPFPQNDVWIRSGQQPEQNKPSE